MSALSGIRKAVVATAGTASGGLLGIVTAVNYNLSAITEGQVSGVLFLALVTGVGTFAIKNKKLAAIIGEVEHVAADAGGSAFTSLQPHLVELQADLVAALAPLAPGAHAAPETTPTPNTPGV